MPDSPYVGLKPYTDEDALRFFGREEERKIIADNMIASRLTLLYGASGVGKSSVLRAGVLYHLRAVAQRNLAEHGSADFVVAYFNSWREDPMVYLTYCAQAAIAPYVKDRAADLSASSRDLPEVLRVCSERADASLLIILDQFEEYFLYHPEIGNDGTFDVEFPRAVNSPDLRVSFLISIREDALAKLDRFKGRVPNILGNYLRIHHLNRKAAKAAIEKPIEWYNGQVGAASGGFTVEPALCSAVLDQVQAGQVILGEGQGTLRGTGTNIGALIETAFLQMVMTRLWDEELSKGSHTLRLETLQRLGGARKIIDTHLDTAMSALSVSEQNIAANIFHYLVTPSGTKIAQTLGDLASYADLTRDELAPLLDKLCAPESRILRPVESPADRPKDPRYQIFHDVLATPVLQWRARFVEDRALAEAKHRAHQEARRAELEALARSAGVLRRLSIGLGAVFLLAAIASIFAWTQWRRARAEATLSSSRALSAAAAENVFRDPELSVILALEAVARVRAAHQEVPMDELDALDRAAQASRERLTLDAGPAKVLDVAFTSDGNQLVTVGIDGTTILWDAVTGQRQRTLSSHDGTMALSLDGRLLATISDGRIRVWDVLSGRQLLETASESGVLAASFSPDGLRLGVAKSDSTAEIWDVPSGKKAVVLRGHSDAVEFVTFTPDGKLVATASDDKTARVWDATSGLELRKLDEHKDAVLCAAFSPDGKHLATGGADRMVVVWDTDSGKPLHRVVTFRSSILRIAFDPNQQLFATAGADGTARLFDGEKFLFALAGHTNRVSNIAFSRDGHRVATASWDGSAKVWDVTVSHPGGVQGVAFSHDGARLASVGRDGVAKLWDAAALKVLRTFPKQQTALTSVSFGPVDRFLATTSVDGTVKIWDASSGAELHALKEPTVSTAVNEVAISPDGALLVTANDDGTAVVWDTVSGRVSRRLTGHTAKVLCVAFSPDGKRVATGSTDHTVRIWDMVSEKPPLTSDLYDGPVTSVAFSPDGNRLASSSLDGSAVIRDAANGRELVRLRGHNMMVTGIVFNNDGTRVATGSLDRTARVWDAAAGREVLEFTHQLGVEDVDFSPDGSKLATGSEDGMVRVIPLDTEELLRLARSRVTRRPRPEECARYMHSACPALVPSR